jgi:hypothetical protein
MSSVSGDSMPRVRFGDSGAEMSLKELADIVLGRGLGRAWKQITLSLRTGRWINKTTVKKLLGQLDLEQLEKIQKQYKKIEDEKTGLGKFAEQEITRRKPGEARTSSELVIQPRRFSYYAWLSPKITEVATKAIEPSTKRALRRDLEEKALEFARGLRRIPHWKMAFLGEHENFAKSYFGTIAGALEQFASTGRLEGTVTFQGKKVSVREVLFLDVSNLNQLSRASKAYMLEKQPDEDDAEFKARQDFGKLLQKFIDFSSAISSSLTLTVVRGKKESVMSQGLTAPCKYISEALNDEKGRQILFQFSGTYYLCSASPKDPDMIEISPWNPSKGWTSSKDIQRAVVMTPWGERATIGNQCEIKDEVIPALLDAAESAMNKEILYPFSFFSSRRHWENIENDAFLRLVKNSDGWIKTLPKAIVINGVKYQEYARKLPNGGQVICLQKKDTYDKGTLTDQIGFIVDKNRLGWALQVDSVAVTDLTEEQKALFDAWISVHGPVFLKSLQEHS